MDRLAPGTFVFVSYVGFDLWHERMVLAWIDGGEYLVLTPDGDMYIERLDLASRDLDGLRICIVHRELPFGLTGQQLYRFGAPPEGLQLAGLMAEAAGLGRAERVSRGLPAVIAAGAAPGVRAIAVVPVPLPAPAAPGAGAAAAPPPPRIAPAGGIWVLDEAVGTYKISQEVVLPPGVLQVGHRALVEIDGDTVSITHLVEGVDIDSWARKRTRAFAQNEGRIFFSDQAPEQITLGQAEKLMLPGPASFPDLKGPPTMTDTIHSMIQKGGDFETTHDKWVVNSKIDPTHRSVHEHRILMRAFKLAVAVDRFNIKQSAAFEYLNRRRQLIEQAHSEDPLKPSFESAHLYMGEDELVPGVQMSPALRKHIADELGREAAIDKERRKAREAKQGLKRKEGKGGGKDKDAP